MAEKSAIEWTDATVNFWWGCTKVGPGCDHCYAETWPRRTGGQHWGVGVPRRKISSAAALLHRLDGGSGKWFDAHGRRRRVFVQSMSDLFDLDVPIDWFLEAWVTIEGAHGVDAQIVTKRISAVEKRLAGIGRTIWPYHAGLIITVCNQDEADRDIPRLLALKSKLGIPWVGLSIEPMLDRINLNRINVAGHGWHDVLRGWRDCKEYPGREELLDWVIVGGESGKGARDNDFITNARSLLNQCKTAGVPFFGKQNVGKKPLPEDLMVREMPKALAA